MEMFSVLIPVYNTERYLRECINSVLDQTVSDFEIVLVDDGSKDASGAICDEFASYDKRVRVIHQKNQGPLMARLRAFQEAQGDFVVYMDSDDLWSKELLETVKDVILRYNCDIVSFKWKYMDEAGNFLEGDGFQHSSELIEHSIEQLIARFLTGETENSLCKRVVRKRCVNNSQMELLTQIKDIYLGEDMIQSFIMIKDCKSMVHLDKVFYFYRMNSQSLTHNITIKSAIDIAKARGYLREILEVSGYNQPQYKEMLDKTFLEHYLTDMVGIADYYSVEGLKKTAAEIKRLEIYKNVQKHISGCELSLKRRLLYDLDRREWWRCFWVISKIYRKLVCKEKTVWHK
jgi:Glycosyltransferases involved in cell wall biogenesis